VTSASDSLEVAAKTPATSGFRVWRAGLVNYHDALACQTRWVDQRSCWDFDLLALLQHPPVITLGRSTNRDHLLWSPAMLKAAGIDCVETRRGGDITLHSPGQLVGYPIVALHQAARDLHRFLRRLETVILRTLADFNLTGHTVPGKTGVWIANRKIASIGIAVRRWISYHGFALNIDNDLTAFAAIVPCGLQGVTMTSLQQETGRPIRTVDVVDLLVDHYGDVMQQPLLGDFDEQTEVQQT
jgi:lipoyl(octanoyl) transferase